MQKVKIEFPNVDGKIIKQEFEADEYIGMRVGRGIYATARVTAKKIAKANNPLHWVWVRVNVNDGEYSCTCRIVGGKWITENEKRKSEKE